MENISSNSKRALNHIVFKKSLQLIGEDIEESIIKNPVKSPA